MNVRDMLNGVPINYPTITIREVPDGEEALDWNWFRLDLPNGWRISCAYGRMSYSDNHLTLLPEPKDSLTVEIAIFNPQGEWQITENMDNIYESEDGTRTGVLAWQTSDQLFRIVDYLMAQGP